ncbi:hypothetical protein [Fluviicola taffensis]|uniref:Uncharacterized protein n=1 Tax=Fluviicola taffensis (strain DSM 16823 / NCIMB 13979 / RW262) TaxID=755732 RepID=F2IFP2_FLUTR|nr:hypothetical protein [Fluviicola taffensis]AEA42500.1 hypothetical protein Fluta_0495 [Fluviicola taffensis DSM 16823]
MGLRLKFTIIALTLFISLKSQSQRPITGVYYSSYDKHQSIRIDTLETGFVEKSSDLFLTYRNKQYNLKYSTISNTYFYDNDNRNIFKLKFIDDSIPQVSFTAFQEELSDVFFHESVFLPIEISDELPNFNVLIEERAFKYLAATGDEVFVLPVKHDPSVMDFVVYRNRGKEDEQLNLFRASIHGVENGVKHLTCSDFGSNEKLLYIYLSEESVTISTSTDQFILKNGKYFFKRRK